MLTRIYIATFLVVVLFLQVVCAETAQTGTAQYAVDLEKKHNMLDSIKEDMSTITIPQSGSIKSGSMNDAFKISDKLVITGEDLTRIMPPSSKLPLEIRERMCGMLKPETNLKTISKDKMVDNKKGER